GPTVYDFAHIGNARPVIVFDVLYRLLKHVYSGPGTAVDGSRVTYVRNITDVDDKINARALKDHPGLELNEAIRKVTETTAAQFHRDVAALGCLEPTVEPRATDNIAGMVALIQTLLDQGHAYVARGGEGLEVLFDVGSMPDYGGLSKRNLDEQQAGARVAEKDHKRNPGDFVLWKQSDADQPGWDGGFRLPDGEAVTIHGRPGWHIECSAMSERYLWSEIESRLSDNARENPHQFDIHGGGLDLIFPHHENEIAQSRCAFDRPSMAQIWMHNGFLQVEGQKMSKSLGNFVTIHDLLSGTGRRPRAGEVVRLAMLATHYRQPIDFTEEKLEYWWQKLRSWVEIIDNYASDSLKHDLSVGIETISPSIEIVSALEDDLNFQLVITFLDQLQNQSVNNEQAANELARNLIWLGLLRWYRHDAFLRQMTQVKPHLISKYQYAIDDTSALALNFYDWSVDSAIREKSRRQVEDLANERLPGLASDGVRVILGEHFDISLAPIHAQSAFESSRVDTQIALRLTALAAKDFAKADAIRAELLEKGIQLMDYKDPETGGRRTKWEIKR
ncbi:MAG: cysteine--tRNA ligase, partial [Alphaproteobacteria bacterium]|nr:cysteine--tRNA ligase [Alphaproteobacteria bacterium]